VERSKPTLHAFVVRIWLEEAARGGKPALWRGSIGHVLSREKIYFQDLSKVLAFIKPYVQQMTDPETPP
jgi:hypothetical protein